MDCCGEEGAWKGDAKFEIKRVADGVHVAVAAPAYKVPSGRRRRAPAPDGRGLDRWR